MFNSFANSQDLKKVYFAGGCFWCMEESFDQINGVISTISGYSGGHFKNPTYQDVIYKDTGHVETIEVTYDPKIVSYEKLLEIYWKNIDPFDSLGQFCDKGKHYRSVIFFQTQLEKEFIDKSFKKLDDICEECKKNDKSVRQNLIMHSYKICDSCNLAKKLFPI